MPASRLHYSRIGLGTATFDPARRSHEREADEHAQAFVGLALAGTAD